MIKDWLTSTRALFIKFRLNESNTIFRPQFRLTSIVVWLFAIAGLVYGHVVTINDGAKPASLLLSGIAALGALFLIVLQNPVPRLKLFLRQLGGLILVIFAFVFGAITLLVLNSESAGIIIKITWTLATFLLLGLGIRQTFLSYFRLDSVVTEYYPGIRSTALIGALFIVNYLLWVYKFLT